MENREIARISFLRILILGLVLPVKRSRITEKLLRMTIFRFCLRTFSSLKVTMHTSIVRSLFVLAQTSSHSSSSPGVESNQKNFNLIRIHQAHLLVRRHHHWMYSRVTPTQPTVRLWGTLGLDHS